MSQPWRFAGQYWDEETGLHYNVARYYAPRLGRYLSRDPLWPASGVNAYAYAGNEPVHASDPLGLWQWSWGRWVATGAFVALGVAAIVIAAPMVAAGAATIWTGTTRMGTYDANLQRIGP